MVRQHDGCVGLVCDPARCRNRCVHCDVVVFVDVVEADPRVNDDQPDLVLFYTLYHELQLFLVGQDSVTRLLRKLYVEITPRIEEQAPTDLLRLNVVVHEDGREATLHLFQRVFAVYDPDVALLVHLFL